MLIYWLIADRDTTFMNFHSTMTFLTTRRAIDYYMWHSEARLIRSPDSLVCRASSSICKSLLLTGELWYSFLQLPHLLHPTPELAFITRPLTRGNPETSRSNPGKPTGQTLRNSAWHTAHYVQLSHFIYFSPSSASTEGEYGILEPKFTDGGHCQSVLRRQWVLLLPPSMSG